MSTYDLVGLRHHIHSIAEVSGEEDATAAFIKKTIKDCEPDELITGIGGYGILAQFGRSSSGPSVLIRCELDALPIAEENNFDYVSKTVGVGHKCGHDGHMAIVCGVARNLSKRSFSNSCIYLLFQPAEETGKGARLVLDEEKFRDINPDFVFALHNVPGYERDTIVLRSGPFAAASIGFVARFKGESAHAAHPEQGNSPAQGVAQLIQSLSAVPQFYTPIDKVAKVTIVQVHIGEEAFGTSPANGEVMATLRTYDDDNLKELKDYVKQLTEGIAATYNLELETAWVEPFPATINDKEAIDIVRSVADEHNFTILEKETPFGWSEDFGHFTDVHKGALFGLGSGTNHPALHAASYDFPDEIIETGVKMFTGIIDQVIKIDSK